MKKSENKRYLLERVFRNLLLKTKEKKRKFLLQMIFFNSYDKKMIKQKRKKVR